MDNVINFDDIMNSFGSEIEEHKSNNESNGFNHFVLTDNEALFLEEYFNDETFKNRKFIEMFESKYDGSFSSAARALFDLDVYMFENVKLFDERSGSEYINDECLNYADFYEYFAFNFLNDGNILNYLYFHFNDSLPRILLLGEAISREYRILLDAYYFDKMAVDDKRSAFNLNKVMDTVLNCSEVNSAWFVLPEENGKFTVTSNVLFAKEMPQPIFDRSKMILKSGILNTNNSSGYLMLIRFDGQSAKLSSLKIDNGSVYTMSKDDTDTLLPCCLKEESFANMFKLFSMAGALSHERLSLDFV